VGQEAKERQNKRFLAFASSGVRLVGLGTSPKGGNKKTVRLEVFPLWDLSSSTLCKLEVLPSPWKYEDWGKIYTYKNNI
jgi:hypothetical protein